MTDGDHEPLSPYGWPLRVQVAVVLAGVALGPGVLVTSASHVMSSPRRRQGPVEPRPVRIGRGAWVGARAVILPGVTVGAGCVVAAGAVVTKDTEPDTLYGGVPARPLRQLEPTVMP